ncbi:MAG: hypothetical protein IPP83_09895 [Flavobacteriales bacterium]|nr:hypothetical protein [Flavobacteriales bacterium]
MSKYQCLIIVGCALITSMARAQSLQWLTHFGNDSQGYNSGYALESGANGTIFCAGRVAGPTMDFSGEEITVSGCSDAVLLKMDCDGNILWVRHCGGTCSSTDTETGELVAYNSATGTCIMAGNYMTTADFCGTTLPVSDCGEQINMFVASFDSDGNCNWVASAQGKAIRPLKVLFGSSEVLVFGDGELYNTTFDETPPVSIPSGAFIAHYSMEGELMGVQRIMKYGDVQDAEWLSGDLVLAGNFNGLDSLFDISLNGSSALSDGFVALVSATGTIQWVEELRSDSAVVVFDTEIYGGHVQVSGLFWDNMVVGEDTLDSPGSTQAVFLVQFSVEGDLEWMQQINSPVEVAMRDHEVDAMGNAYVLGFFQDTLACGTYSTKAGSTREIYVARFDSLGSISALIRGGRTRSSGPSGILLAGGTVTIASNFDSTLVFGESPTYVSGTGAVDVFVAKFDSIVGFTGPQPIAGGEGSLMIHVNSDQGTCRVELPSSIAVGESFVLSIVDAAGRSIQQTPLVIGDDRVRVNIPAQPRGIYQVELTDGRSRYVGRIHFE